MVEHAWGWPVALDSDAAAGPVPLSLLDQPLVLWRDAAGAPVLLAAGLCATIHSDDPAYFGGHVNQNFVDTFAALPMRGAGEA